MVSMEVETVNDAEFARLEAVCRVAESLAAAQPAPHALPASVTAPPPAPLPFLVYRGQTRYCGDVDSVDRAAAHLLALQPAAVGFDIEWLVTYETGVPPRPVALIQCSFHDTSAYPAQLTCLLLHIAASGLTPALAQLLASPAIPKVGVGISNDTLKLGRD